MTEMTRSARARLLLGATLCAVGAIGLPTTGPLPAQEPSVRVHVEPAVAMVGEQIRLTIEVFGASEVEDPTDLRYSLFRFIDRRPDRALPFATEITAPPTGQVGGTVTFAYSLVANTAGSFEVGPFEVTADGRKLQTEPVTLLVTFPDLGAISVRARVDRTEVEVMEEFELIVDVTPADAALAWPDLSDILDFAATERSERGDGSMIFRLVATAPGTHEIGPIAFEVGEDVIKTEPVTLVVVGDRVYVGEPVIVTYRVLSRDMMGFEGWRVEGDDTLVLPPHDNFRLQRLRSRRIRRERVSADGRRYRVASQHRVVFSPIEAGETAIKPAEFTVQVNQRSRVDAFEMNEAEREGTWTPMTIATEPVPIEVVPLPAEGRPGSFRGHVGRLEMASWIDRTDMEIGHTVTLRVEVSGLSPVAPDPEFAFPAGFEVSEPEIGPVDRGDVSDLREARRYVYRLVANREGSQRIPLVEVSWFDLESQSYGTSSTEPFDVAVVGVTREGGG